MKKKCLITLYFSIVFLSISFAQLPANCGSSSPRVVIAGDSWAQFIADDGTYNTVLNRYGHADKQAISETFELCIGCLNSPGANDYAVSGSEARQWADEANYDYLQNLIDALNANPTVDWVALSIGGNDILAGRSGGGWYKNMDLDVAGSEAALFATIQADTEYIMDEVWSRVNPNIKFMISSYDFPNFNVSALYCGFYACPKRTDLSRDEDGSGIVENDELITDAEITGMMESVEGIRKNMATGNPLIYYDNGMGLTHYYYGYDDGLYASFLPGTTAHPLGVSPYISGGNPNTPTNRGNFRLVGLFGLPGLFSADPIHLDAETYEYKIKNQLDNLLFEDFRKNGSDNFETFWSTGSQDGYVDIIGSSTNSSGIRVGDDGPFCCSGPATKDYRGIFSFNTASLPNNAQVTGASLYFIRSSENDNPFEKGDRNPVLDIKSGHFGTNANLEAADGTDAADAADIGCFHGEAEEDKYAIRVDIETAGLAHINNAGTTQLRMYFDVADWSAEYINFYDGTGIAALLEPEVEAAQYTPKYAYRVVKKTKNTDGTITEEEIEKGPIVEPREGYVLQEKLKEIREEDNGDILEFHVLYTPLEHSGLAKYMSNTYAAPSNGFAPFLDVSYILVLPIELSEFHVSKKDNTALLDWIINSERDSYGFFVEHSSDKNNWQELGFISSKGDSEIINEYQFIHQSPEKGDNYYRLRIEDLDGEFAYSDIKNLSFQDKLNFIKVFPNPFSDEVFFELNSEENSFAEVQLIDVMGRVVFMNKIEILKEKQTYYLNKLSKLSKGNYLLQIINNKQVFHAKLVKE